MDALEKLGYRKSKSDGGVRYYINKNKVIIESFTSGYWCKRGDYTHTYIDYNFHEKEILAIADIIAKNK